ncbi:unnamed protein product [Nesidiocoris tenuis]|uniref:Band 7 domain-containing protein n=1 Tax=Nesidiocoris tenuis TaxID=355587 RepID=A0A6H5GKI6_9HEMI|nr:unnamed protein product [Nesidiocoris tenuis]
MGAVLTVGPNEALIVSGGLRQRKKRVIVAGWAWVSSSMAHASYLPLTLMTVYPECQDVETVMGVAVTVSGVAHVKIKRELITVAAEQFGGKKKKDIREAVGATVEGHLRAILGSLTVEEIYRGRAKFAKSAKIHAEKDMARMGMQIISFTITDIFDSVGYLDSLGKKQIAEVKRSAAIAVADNEAIASMRENECLKEAMDTVYEMKTKIENSKKQSEMLISGFEAEVNAAKAEVALAYSLQEAVVRQKIRAEEMEVEVIQRRKEIDIEDLEIKRKEMELKATVELPAEAESYRMEQMAEAERTQAFEAAKAAAHHIEHIGTSTAGADENVGTASANTLLMKANVFKDFNDAAIISLVLDHLPKIIAHAASPLTKTEEIVILTGEAKLGGELTKLASQIPAAMAALDATSKIKKLKENL